MAPYALLPGTLRGSSCFQVPLTSLLLCGTLGEAKEQPLNFKVTRKDSLSSFIPSFKIGTVQCCIWQLVIVDDLFVMVASYTKTDLSHIRYVEDLVPICLIISKI